MKLSRKKVTVIWIGMTALVIPLCNIIYRYHDFRIARAELKYSIKREEDDRKIAMELAGKPGTGFEIFFKSWEESKDDLNKARNQYEKQLRKLGWAKIFLFCCVSLFIFFLIFYH